MEVHPYGFCSFFVLKLFEKAQVVLEEQANVGDTVLSHGEALDAETEGPAGVLFAVDADGVEDVGDGLRTRPFRPSFPSRPCRSVADRLRRWAR